MTVDAAKIIAPPKLSFDEQLHRTYTSIYQVIADTTDGPLEVTGASGLPRYGYSFSYESTTDLWAFCRSVEVDPSARIEDNGIERIKWVLTYKHSSKPFSHNPNKSRNNPLDDPPIIGGTFVNYSKVAHRDREDNPILNTAKDPYDPPIETEDAYDTLTIQYNTPKLNLGLRASYRNAVNSTPIWGLPKRRAKIVKWDYKVLYAGVGLEYIQNSFEFHISYKEHAKTDVAIGTPGQIGWYTSRPNSGDEYWFGGWGPAKDPETEKRKFTEETDHPSGKGWLTAEGDKLIGSQLFNVYEIEPEKDFTAIPGMPNPLPGPFV